MASNADDAPIPANDPMSVRFGRRRPARNVDQLQGIGLRERKKLILRQQISDTATLMFLDRGFDEVRVSEIAEACDISEKTVFNYFPTKESLLFDREEPIADLLHQAFSATDTDESLVDIIIRLVVNEVDEVYSNWDDDDSTEESLAVMRSFADLIEGTPALGAAMHAMMERLTQVIAGALGERAGVDPYDPEPQMAAVILMGLWRGQFQSMHRFANSSTTVGGYRSALLADLQRSARVADSGLSSFNLVVQQTNTKQQLADAADAANLARKQVIAAVKQARTAWKQVMVEAQNLHQIDEARDDIKRSQQALRKELRQRQDELRRQQIELRRRQQRGRR